jgi:predicted ATPase
MARIEGFKVKNFRTLKDVTLGRLWNEKNKKPLTPMTAVIGKNGVGKSSLFDIFGFLADCLKLGCEEACITKGRGGFNKLRTQNQNGAVEFEICYRENSRTPLISYALEIQMDKSGSPFVLKESLTQLYKGELLLFFIMENGRGVVWKGNQDGIKIGREMTEFDLSSYLKSINNSEIDESGEIVEFEDSSKPGIATLGSFKQYPRISALKKFIEEWYLSYFSPDSARSLPMAGPQKHLNSKGDNIGNVVQFMEQEHKKLFKSILDRIADKIPGIDKIETEKTSDGRLLIRFNDKGFTDPFYAQQMSDGTLKIFAYLLLLEDPEPPPFICIEEPETGLYHKLLETLVHEFRQHATGKKGRAQIFVTTHQPYFVDALNPDEVWILEKTADGFSTVSCAGDDEIVKNMVEEGLPLGGLWYSDYLDER